jgi:hypothetical protein
MMMKSLFNAAENRELIDRIGKLTPSTPALWGKMRVDQMLAHCQAPFKVAYGELNLKRGLIGLLFGGMAKKQMSGNKPFKQNLPTHPKFLVADQRVFNEEKEKLESCIVRFNNPKAIVLDTHPFFGKMSPDEWDNLMWKHLDHHLRQFGV